MAGDIRDETHDAQKSTKDRGEAREARRQGRERDGAECPRSEARCEGHCHDVKHDTKDTASNVGHDTREATGTAGQAVSDGWITTKVKSSFVGVDALEGSDINVDTNGHIVTLRGTVPSATARARAVSLAKQVDGVKSVKDELTIGAKK